MNRAFKPHSGRFVLHRQMQTWTRENNLGSGDAQWYAIARGFEQKTARELPLHLFEDAKFESSVKRFNNQLDLFLCGLAAGFISGAAAYDIFVHGWGG